MYSRWILLLTVALLGFSCYQGPRDEENIDIQWPDSTTAWKYLEENTYVTFENESGYVFSTIDLYRNGEYAGMYLSGTFGYFTVPERVEALDSAWIPGNNYRIKITDEYNNWGWSEPFQIVSDSSGSGGSGSGGSIVISYPEDNSEWKYEQATSFVEWENPTSSEIMFEIYVDNSLLGVYLDWTDNDGFETRTEPLDQLWVPRAGYQIKAIDSDGNYGWSASFKIVDSN